MKESHKGEHHERIPLFDLQSEQRKRCEFKSF